MDSSEDLYALVDQAIDTLTVANKQILAGNKPGALYTIETLRMRFESLTENVSFAVKQPMER